MSTSDQIKKRVAEGRVVEFDPGNGERIGRPLYMTKSLAGTILGPWGAGSEDEHNMPIVQVLLTKFVNELPVAVCFKPQPKGVEIRRLSRNGGRPYVWEFREASTLPQYRVFGVFAAHNVFFASDIVDRDIIGNFDQEYEDVMDEWRALFSGYVPLESGDVNGYLSNAFLIK